MAPDDEAGSRPQRSTTSERLVVAAALAQALLAAALLAFGHGRVALWLLAMSLILTASILYSRYLQRRTPLELQILAWAAAASVLLAIAVLSTVGVVAASAFETVCLYVSAVAAYSTAYFGHRGM